MASLTNKIFASLKAGGSSALSAPPAQPQSTTTSPSATASASSATAVWKERFCHVAIQGCCHGELDRIYGACAEHERQTGKRIDMLICCGDFQAVRTPREMDSMAVPDKFKVMGDFHKYCCSSSTAGGGGDSTTAAPYLTIFVGGNHENSDLLAQESYGGFVAPNIYYLGHSGVVTVDNCLRIAGLSGIFKEQDYDRPYPPRPYAANQMWKKGAYHVRRVEVAKLHAYLRAAQQIERCSVETNSAKAASTLPLVDVFVSHDWPVGITSYGDEAQLLRYKPYFRDDIRRHALGNPHTMQLLREAKPLYWVSAHLHCFFEATVSHTFSRSTADDAQETPTAPTSFVALDKCAKGSGFLTFLDLPRHHRDGGEPADGPADAEKKTSEAHHSAADGTQRIRREPLWLEVLTASHPSLAANSTTDTPREAAGASRYAEGNGRPRHAFDVADTVRHLVERHTNAESLHSSTSASNAALFAPSTAALLAALQLPPALPLQQQALSTSGAQPSIPSGYDRNPGRQWEAPRREDVSSAPRPHQRSRMETPATAGEVPWFAANVQPSTAPSAAPSASLLSFFEDVATAPAPSNTAAKPADASPAPLGWFEDTVQ